MACLDASIAFHSSGWSTKEKGTTNECYIIYLSPAIPKDTDGRPSSIPIGFVTKQTQGLMERQGDKGTGEEVKTEGHIEYRTAPHREGRKAGRTKRKGGHARVVREIVRES